MDWLKNAGEYTYDAVASTVPATKAAVKAFGDEWSRDMERRAIERAAEALATRKMKEIKDAMVAEATKKIGTALEVPSKVIVAT